MGCHSKALGGSFPDFSDWGSSLWALSRRAEPRRGIQPHSHLSANRQTVRQWQSRSHTETIALSSPCHLKSSLTHWCSFSVAELSQGHPAWLEWTLHWCNSLGWKDKRSKRCHRYISGCYFKSKTKECACSLVKIKENEQSFLGNRTRHLTLHGNNVIGAPAQDENWNTHIIFSTGRRKILEFLLFSTA